MGYKRVPEPPARTIPFITLYYLTAEPNLPLKQKTIFRNPINPCETFMRYRLAFWEGKRIFLIISTKVMQMNEVKKEKLNDFLISITIVFFHTIEVWHIGQMRTIIKKRQWIFYSHNRPFFLDEKENSELGEPNWLPAILTQFVFVRRMSYLCNSKAGLTIGKSRFFSIFRAFLCGFQPYFHRKLPVFEFKIQVFVLKFEYGLLWNQYFKLLLTPFEV